MSDQAPNPQTSAQPPSGGDLLALLAWRVAQTPQGVALRHLRQGAWVDVSWAQAAAEARKLGAGLRALGVSFGDRVGIMSRTRYEWVVGYWGVLMAGGVCVAMDASGLRTQLRSQLEATEVRAVLVEDPVALGKLIDACHSVQTQPKVIFFDVRAPRGGRSDKTGSGVLMLDEVIGWPPPEHVVSFDEVLLQGQALLEREPGCLQQVQAAVQPQTPAGIAYSTGTSGAPRAVRLSHANFVWAARALAQTLACGEADVQLLSLPLAHLAGRVLLWVGVQSGMTSALQEEDAEARLDEVKPTFFAQFPTFFERFRAGLVAEHEGKGRVKRRLFGWALQRTPSDGSPQKLFKRMRDALSERWVIQKLKDRLGGKVKAALAVGGALAPEVGRFFHALGVPLMETYGLVEGTGITHINGPIQSLSGGVGRPLPEVEVKLSAQSEVLLKGPCLALGVGDKDGWVPTGDLGALDDDGGLRVLGRKSQLIRLSDGREVNPSLVEQQLKAHPLINQVLIYGHDRPFLTALLTLHEAPLRVLAQTHGLDGLPTADLTQTRAVFVEVEGILQRCHRALTPAEHIRKFAILEQELTRDAGELTLAMQVRRAFSVARYRAVLDSFYTEQF